MTLLEMLMICTMINDLVVDEDMEAQNEQPETGMMLTDPRQEEEGEKLNGGAGEAVEEKNDEYIGQVNVTHLI